MIVNLDIPSSLSIELELEEVDTPVKVPTKLPEELIRAFQVKSRAVISGQQVEIVMPHVLDGLN